MPLEEHAAAPLAGGIMQHGYQCGMIWGAALAAGAQAYRLYGAGAQAETLHINRLLETPALFDGFQVLCIPGGFSYGDDVAAGRILANQMAHHLAEEMTRFKAEGKLKYAGVSSHGPRGSGDSMERVLCAAAEDGRFDLMLLVYNFMNREAGEKILKACKKNNVAPR